MRRCDALAQLSLTAAKWPMAMPMFNLAQTADVPARANRDWLRYEVAGETSKALPAKTSGQKKPRPPAMIYVSHVYHAMSFMNAGRQAARLTEHYPLKINSVWTTPVWTAWVWELRC
jgi:hypothetical protein